MLVLRAITQDSWFYWRHALPANPRSRLQLQNEQALWIEALAGVLQRVHAGLPGYSRLYDSPVHVRRWLDPHEPGTPWAEGRRCQFRIEPFSAFRVKESAKVHASPKHLHLRSLDDHWLEATLLAIPVRNRKPRQSSRASGRK
jgi:hypothetical protein